MGVLKKSIVVLALLLMVDLLIACCGGCPEPIIGNYSNCSTTIENLQITQKSSTVTESKSLSKYHYGIRVTIQRSEDVCMKRNNSLFTQSAYACDCDFDKYFPRDSIVAVVVKTENDFDEEHPAGSDISDLFEVDERYYIGISDYIETIELIEYDNVGTFEFDLVMRNPPTIGTKHQFEVIIEFSDGRVQNAYTGVLELH